MTLSMLLSFVLLIHQICRVNGDVKLVQKQSVVKSVGKSVYIDCNYASDCQSYIHWYQQKEGETLRRILYSGIADGAAYANANADSFKIEKKGSNMALKIPGLKTEHSAVYYCACWIAGGTVIKNTENPVQKLCKLPAPCKNHKPPLYFTKIK